MNGTRATRAAAVSALACAAAIALTPRAAAADAGAAPPLPACIQVTTTARWVPYGYQHIVTLKSGCSRAAACSVSTDVNPEPQRVDVAPSTSVEVTTFMASPSSTFRAYASCSLR